MKVLIIADQKENARTLVRELRGEYYAVDAVKDRESGLLSAKDGAYDAIIIGIERGG